MKSIESVGVSRRAFVQAAGSASAAFLVGGVPLTAAARARSIGANERIRIGLVGCGDRGINAHMAGVHRYVKDQNVEFTAVCDPWRVARENAVAAAEKVSGRKPKTYESYRDMLADGQVDAVMIASCDHQHTTHLEAVAKAGLHVYAEKPLATDFDKLVKACDTVREAGVVCQIGTQIRSLPSIAGCRNLVQDGTFGVVTRVEENRNSEKPYWYSRLKDVRKEDVNWEEFLMDRPMRPFRADLYSGWYGYYEFSQGPVAGLGVHYIDLVHYITGAQFPESCVCLGGTYYWKDEHGFTAPDQAQALWSYPEGFFVSYATNFGNGFGNRKRLYGDKGTLKFDNWSAPTYSAEGGPKRDGSIRGENPVPPVERPEHFLDWLQCMRTGDTPHASIEAGFQHGVAVLMAATSYQTGRKAIYDPVKREIRTV